MDVNDIHFEPKQPATAPRLVGSESRNFVSKLIREVDFPRQIPIYVFSL